MKRVGRVRFRGVFCATVVWGGASGVAGVCAKEEAERIRQERTQKNLSQCMGDRVALATSGESFNQLLHYGEKRRLRG
jgi:hypothetical protein